MQPSPLAACFLGLVSLALVAAADEEKPPKSLDLLKGPPEKFLKALDRDRDGFLRREELPQRLAENFGRFDQNRDDKLDRKEVEQLMAMLRRQVPKPGAPTSRTGMADRVVSDWLDRLDKDKDGKLTKEEARDRLAQGFARFDANRDGALDKKELTAAAERFVAMQGQLGDKAGPGRPGGKPDFDALDKDADGRLTAEELRGTPFGERFSTMDRNGDGKLDRKEFEASPKKQEAGKPK
jgi:hypothetical protein